MTPESFDALASVLSDPILLLSPRGVIRAANRSGREAIESNDGEPIIGRNLADLILDPQQSLAAMLRAARRTSDDTYGSLRIQGGESRRVIVRRIDNPNGRSWLLLRIEPQELLLRQFSILNEKIEQFNREISKRRQVEGQLLIERDIAEFGRDVGLALVDPQTLTEALSTCTDLMVDRLGASFARIWLANDERTELHLAASSGRYTHLDGAHGRIRFGEYKIGRIAQTQVPHVTNSVIGDEQIHDQTWARQEGMVAFVGCPLIDDDVTVGVIGLFAKKRLSDVVSAALTSVANSIALRIRKQSSEDELARQTMALELAGRRKDEFLAMLSHELRNPLAPVRTGLDLLSLENTGHDDTIQMMQNQVEHLVRLVDDLLDVSRIMRGKVELRKEVLEVAPLVQHARETLSGAISEAEHQLQVTIPEEPIWIDADGVRIVQVVENLLKNACKYTDRGGQIMLAVIAEQRCAKISIKDNGIGIERELLSQVFDPFAQSQRTLDRSQGGLGIGLTLVRSLVEMHGGNVTAHSEGLGSGSEFTIELPRCAAPEVTAPEAMPDRKTPAAPLRILAVDDNRAARMMLARLFRKLGAHQVETAEDAPSAIKVFTGFLPDLVLLDIGLPGMDGYQLAASLRRHRADDSFLLVALTGYGQKEDRRKSKEAGFDEHLVKPPSIDQLRMLLSHPKLVERTSSRMDA